MSDPSNIVLVPRDGFFFKDGRGWYTSASGRGYGLDWPHPSTVLGALRTAYGRLREEARAIRFGRGDWIAETKDVKLGPMIALRRRMGEPWRAADRIWQAPADALRLEGVATVERLDPVHRGLPTLGADDDPARERLWRPVVSSRAKPLTMPRWWREDEFVRWLSGEPVDMKDVTKRPRLTERVQMHVGISRKTLAAEESLLFLNDVRETLERDHEWGIGCRVELPAATDLTAGPVTLGGDGRLARVEKPDSSIFEPPQALLKAFDAARSPGFRLVAVTGLAFERGWIPDGFTSDGADYRGRLPGIDACVVLRAAYVPRPTAVSGWDMTKGTNGQAKPTTRLVPPGAVYFFERCDGEPVTGDQARSLWNAACGERVAEGFGRVAPGVWKTEGDES